MAEILAFLGGILAGYVVGRIDLIKSLLTKSDSPTSFLSQSTQKAKTQLKTVSIDESTFVTKVDDDFVPSGVTLGTTTSMKDDIGAASSKLAQLKKVKG